MSTVGQNNYIFNSLVSGDAVGAAVVSGVAVGDVAVGDDFSFPFNRNLTMEVVEVDGRDV